MPRLTTALLALSLSLVSLAPPEVHARPDDEIVPVQNPDGTWRTIRDPDGDGKGYTTSGGHETKKEAEKEAKRQNRELRKMRRAGKKRGKGKGK